MTLQSVKGCGLTEVVQNVPDRITNIHHRPIRQKSRPSAQRLDVAGRALDNLGAVLSPAPPEQPRRGNGGKNLKGKIPDVRNETQLKGSSLIQTKQVPKDLVGSSANKDVAVSAGLGVLALPLPIRGVRIGEFSVSTQGQRPKKSL